MAAIVFEKCDPEAIVEILQRRMPEKWKRFRSKMVKVLDNYYFKEFDKEELDR